MPETPSNITPADLQRATRRGRTQVQKQANALERLRIEYVTHDRITANSYNPNRQSENDFELLCRSMEEDGITQPIVCVVDPDREGNFIIVDGEHRWRASKKIGYTEIPITIVPMTPEQARIATLRHNRARGSEDIELSTQVLRDLERLGAKGWALDSLMMSETEFDKLLEDISAPEALENEEFSQSWEPDMLDDADASAAERGDTSLRTVEGAQTLHTALTTAAVEAQRTREENLHAARTEEERSLIKRSNTLVRISLLFSEEEAEFVKRTLGTEAANKFLQILRWYTNGMPEGGR